VSSFAQRFVVTESPKAFNRIALQAGIAVPVLYYGVQLLAAPFYPGYSFITNVASDLGSPTSTVPAIFNVGMFLSGIATMMAAWGYAQALPRIGVRFVLTALVVLSLIGGAIMPLNGAVFPLPDPRHYSGLVFWTGGVLLTPLPLLLLLAMWRGSGRAMRWYLALNLVAFPVLMVMMGTFDSVAGLLQRPMAGTGIVLIGVCAWVLLRRA
jgi:hypothetical membrane protein